MTSTPSNGRALQRKAEALEQLLKEIEAALILGPEEALPTPEEIEQLTATLVIVATRLPTVLSRIADRVETLPKTASLGVDGADEVTVEQRLDRAVRALRDDGLIAAWGLRGALDLARANVGRVRARTGTATVSDPAT